MGERTFKGFTLLLALAPHRSGFTFPCLWIGSPRASNLFGYPMTTATMDRQMGQNRWDTSNCYDLGRCDACQAGAWFKPVASQTVWVQDLTSVDLKPCLAISLSYFLPYGCFLVKILETWSQSLEESYFLRSRDAKV